MSATACVSAQYFVNGVTSMPQPNRNRLGQLRPDLHEVALEILALRAMVKKDKYITYRAQRELLNRLVPSDLAKVALAIEEFENSTTK